MAQKGVVPPQFQKFMKKKGAPVTAKQAQAAAKMVGKKAPMDAEDMIDGGADEATEKN